MRIHFQLSNYGAGYKRFNSNACREGSNKDSSINWIGSCADILWAHHAIIFSSSRNVCRSQGNIPCPLFAHVPITAADFELREVQQTPVWPFQDYVDIKSIDLNIPLEEAVIKVKHLKKKMNIFVHRNLLQELGSIKSWLECWKPVESLLGTWEMIAKCQTTGLSFHQVCETVRIICLNPLWETVLYFAMKRMKCSQIYERGLD